MALEPEDAIPAEFPPEPVVPPEGKTVASGYLRVKLADVPRIGLMLAGLGLYINGLVAAESVSLRVWLGLWLFVAFMLFGNALPQSETPAPQQEPRDRGPEELP
jgi:hypothetical protein